MIDEERWIEGNGLILSWLAQWWLQRLLNRQESKTLLIFSSQ
jgi:hypothetical protein